MREKVFLNEKELGSTVGESIVSSPSILKDLGGEEN